MPLPSIHSISLLFKRNISVCPKPFDAIPNEVLSQILVKAVTATVSPVIADYSNYDNAYADARAQKFVNEAPERDITASFSFPPGCSSKDISSVLRVCRRWRECLLANGRVCAGGINVDRDTLAKAQMLVEHSRGLPLVIQSFSGCLWKFEGVQNLNSPTWGYVLDNMHRWGSFAIQTELAKNDTWDILKDRLVLPAPQLVAFTLKNTRLSDDFSAPEGSQAYVLPEDLFQGTAKLRVFVLRNVGLPSTFQFAMWRNLRVLSLFQFPHSPNGMPFSVRNCLRMLRYTPELEYLEIFGFSEGPLSEPYFVPEPVHLPQLLSFAVKTVGEWDVLFAVLDKLIVPQTCKKSYLVM